MSGKLRLGPLPKAKFIRLTVALPARVKADLDRYAELFGATYGEPVDATALVPHMLATFMERDRAFRRSGHLPATGAVNGLSLETSAAILSTSETAEEESSSR